MKHFVKRVTFRRSPASEVTEGPVTLGGPRFNSTVSNQIDSTKARCQSRLARRCSAYSGRSTVPKAPTQTTMGPKTLRPFVDQITHLRGDPKSVMTEVETATGYGYRVKLGPEGTLRSRVLSLMQGLDDSRLDAGAEGTRVGILRDGRIAGNAISDANGDFYVPGLSTGVYDRTATSNVGYAAFGFETVGTSGLVQSQTDGERMVSKIEEPAEILLVVGVPNALIPQVCRKLLDYYPGLGPLLDEAAFTTGEPIVPYGGMAAPGIVGGGAGGGIGGYVGPGVLTGLEAIAAALSNNDNDGFFIQLASASPSMPESDQQKPR